MGIPGIRNHFACGNSSQRVDVVDVAAVSPAIGSDLVTSQNVSRFATWTGRQSGATDYKDSVLLSGVF